MLFGNFVMRVFLISQPDVIALPSVTGKTNRDGYVVLDQKRWWQKYPL
jgi:hypothetical protein